MLFGFGRSSIRVLLAGLIVCSSLPVKLLSCPLSTMSDDGVRVVVSQARFADGEARAISVADWSGPPAPPCRLATHGFQLVRNNARLLAWCQRWAGPLADGAAVLEPLEESELAGLLADAIVEADERLARDAHWTVGNVIVRQGGAHSYTRAVHRDLDETAVGNLREHDGLVRFYNAWVPLRPVASDPLALLLPDSLAPADPASFLGYNPLDRTGLNYNPDQRWIFFDALQPGDVLLWQSERIFHVSFPLPHQTDANPRASIDMRLYFK